MAALFAFEIIYQNLQTHIQHDQLISKARKDKILSDWATGLAMLLFLKVSQTMLAFRINPQA